MIDIDPNVIAVLPLSARAHLARVTNRVFTAFVLHAALTCAYVPATALNLVREGSPIGAFHRAAAHVWETIRSSCHCGVSSFSSIAEIA